ncbi:MAG: AmmeMemoRadiSam system protein B [Candidatus Aenigmarchaeota archaeon]|nr:AmmeMemoRadiSam system protein B [Candidatus Aenigmarchaeota archaeon]
MLIRPPAVAGEMYSIEKGMLKKEIESSFNHPKGPKSFKRQKVIAAVVPHSSYLTSGPVAAWVYSRLEPSNYLIIGTNHSKEGPNFSISKKGMWKTPLGEVIINEKLADTLASESKILDYDILAHENEYSVEMQLPFLQHKFGDEFKFVPIVVRNDFPDEALLESCMSLGKSIGKVLKKSGETWTVLASSDFSRDLPSRLAKENDRDVIRSILKLDEKNLFSKIAAKNINMCGYGAVATTLAAAKELGAKKGKLLKYATSSEITGEDVSAIGFASIIIY